MIGISMIGKRKKIKWSMRRRQGRQSAAGPSRVGLASSAAPQAFAQRLYRLLRRGLISWPEQVPPPSNIWHLELFSLLLTGLEGCQCLQLQKLLASG